MRQFEVTLSVFRREVWAELIVNTAETPCGYQVTLFCLLAFLKMVVLSDPRNNLVPKFNCNIPLCSTTSSPDPRLLCKKPCRHSNGNFNGLTV